MRFAITSILSGALALLPTFAWVIVAIAFAAGILLSSLLPYKFLCLRRRTILMATRVPDNLPELRNEGRYSAETVWT